MAAIHLTFGSVVWVLVVSGQGLPTDDSPDLVLDWDDGPLPTASVQKRATTKSSSQDGFVENKLVEQGQAIEYLVKLVQESQESLNQLAENLSKEFKLPKSPEKLEVESNSRRSFNAQNVILPTVKPANKTKSSESPIVEKLLNNPIVNMGRKMPKYGLLAKILFLNSIENGSEPTPVVEIQGRNATETRRAESVEVTPKGKPNPWCKVALFCRKDNKVVCGYDEVFGLGKFDDFCHMVNVNCYWDHNFSVVPSCNISQ